MKKQAVHTITFFIVCLFCTCPNISYAQVIAGSVPAGTSIQYPNIMLADSIIPTTVSDSFDIDCDNIKDIALDLHRGYTDVDQLNYVWLRILSDSFEICKDTSHFPVAALYDAGDTLCNGGLHSWMSDSFNLVACGGGIACWDLLLYEATDKYIAYRKTSTQEIGWIKFSYDLWWQNTITASVSEILVLCTGNGTDDIERERFFSITPNPTTDGKVKLQSKNKITRIEIRNVVGQVVKIISESKTELTLPEETGLYILMLTDDKGNLGVEKIWWQ